MSNFYGAKFSLSPFLKIRPCVIRQTDRRDSLSQAFRRYEGCQNYMCLCKVIDCAITNLLNRSFDAESHCRFRLRKIHCISVSSSAHQPVAKPMITSPLRASQVSLYLSRVAPRQTIEHLVHEVLQQIKQPDGTFKSSEDEGEDQSQPPSKQATTAH